MTLAELWGTDPYDDWKLALDAAGVPPRGRLPFLSVVEYHTGFNDGDSWTLVVELVAGCWGAMRAWCDYTGWDCQSGGEWKEFDDVQKALDWVNLS